MFPMKISHNMALGDCSICRHTQIWNTNPIPSKILNIHEQLWFDRGKNTWDISGWFGERLILHYEGWLVTNGCCWMMGCRWTARCVREISSAISTMTIGLFWERSLYGLYMSTMQMVQRITIVWNQWTFPFQWTKTCKNTYNKHSYPPVLKHGVLENGP